MESIKNTPTNAELKKMPYSELKKLAKQHGIKGNMKAEKIIDALCSLNSDDASFSTPAQIEINFSRKNKEKKFDEDVKTPLVTPRRGTYSVESPNKDGSKEEVVNKITPRKLTYSVASPTSDKVGDTSITSVSFDMSSLDVSNVTMGRGSERKCRRKVSFMSPLRVQSTPKNSSIKLRPKTPVAGRISVGKRVSFSSPTGEKKKRSSEMSVRLTPHPRKSSERLLSRRSTPRLRSSFREEHSGLSSSNLEVSSTVPLSSVPESPERQDITTSVQKSEKEGSKSVSNSPHPEVISAPHLPSVSKSPKSQNAAPHEQKSEKEDCKSSSTISHVTRSKAAVKETRFALSGSTVSSAAKDKGDEMLNKMKRTGTPNFKKIHEKAFSKMESIDDYQKRKEQNSVKKINQRPDYKSKVTKAKSKIPAFSGVPFIPSAPTTVCKTLNFNLKSGKDDASGLKPKDAASVETKKHDENVLQKRSKAKFDLKSSLSRKLGYIPYKGPVKPLTESNALNATSCHHKAKEEPVKKVINSNRLQTRSILKGVRTNKRFELQMKNRKL